ncbi:MAG: hypothetical protein V1757_02605 [Actinomycetota bacterium]
MGQQPNLRIGIEDLPRATGKPGPAGRWAPDRPGDMVSPQAVPWGGDFGTPGPDAGFAFNIIRTRALPALEGETRADLEEAVSALMTARASHFGRAPVVTDAMVAEVLLGFGTPDPSWRLAWTRGLAHDHHALRDLVGAIDADALVSPLEAVRRRHAAGERLVAERQVAP